LRGALSALSSW